jgi:hypothetical protein
MKIWRVAAQKEMAILAAKVNPNRTLNGRFVHNLNKRGVTD